MKPNVKSKRKVARIPDETRRILESYWERGLTGYSVADMEKRKLLQEAINETGMEEPRIKDWIGNYRRKKRGRKYQTKPSKRFLRRKLTGYNVFCSEYIKTKIQEGFTYQEAAASLGGKWREEKESGNVESYNAKAAEVSKQRSEVVFKNDSCLFTMKMKEIMNRVRTLELNGYDIVMCVHKPLGQVRGFGTRTGLEFLKTSNIMKEYGQFIKDFDDEEEDEEDDDKMEEDNEEDDDKVEEDNEEDDDKVEEDDELENEANVEHVEENDESLNENTDLEQLCKGLGMKV